LLTRNAAAPRTSTTAATIPIQSGARPFATALAGSVGCSSGSCARGCGLPGAARGRPGTEARGRGAGCDFPGELRRAPARGSVARPGWEGVRAPGLDGDPREAMVSRSSFLSAAGSSVLMPS
jgi:hypothetical protein